MQQPVPSLTAIAMANLSDEQKRALMLNYNYTRNTEAMQAIEQWQAEDAALKDMLKQLHAQEQLYSAKQSALSLYTVMAQHEIASNANNNSISNANVMARAQARTNAALADIGSTFAAMQGALREILRLRRAIDQKTSSVKLLASVKAQLQFLTQSAEDNVHIFLASSIGNAEKWIDVMQQKWRDKTASTRHRDDAGRTIGYDMLTSLMRWAGYDKPVTHFVNVLEQQLGEDWRLYTRQQQEVALHEFYWKSNFLDICNHIRGTRYEGKTAWKTDDIKPAEFFDALKWYVRTEMEDIGEGNDAYNALTCVSDALDRMGLFVGEALSMPATNEQDYNDRLYVQRTADAFRIAPPVQRERITVDFKQGGLGKVIHFMLYQVSHFYINAANDLQHIHINGTDIRKADLPVLFDWIQHGTESVVGFSVWKYYLAHTSGLVDALSGGSSGIRNKRTSRRRSATEKKPARRPQPKRKPSTKQRNQ